MNDKGIENNDSYPEGSGPTIEMSVGDLSSYRSLKDWILIAFWIVLVVALGMVAINQTFEFFYKAEFLKSPCNLCGELNPEVGICLRELNTHESYPLLNGEWSDPLNDSPMFEIKINE